MGYRNSDKPKPKSDRTTVGPSEEAKIRGEEIEARFGFERICEGHDRLGWLMNMQPSDMVQKDTGNTVSAVDFYFMQQDGETFKVTFANYPYFYIYVPPAYCAEVESHLKIKFQKHIHQINSVWKEDLDLRNHLSGLKKQYLQIKFHTINDLLHVRSFILPKILKNEKTKKVAKAYFSWDNNDNNTMTDEIDDIYNNEISDPLQKIEDIREADVPFYVRTSIDYDIRVGFWYDVSFHAGNVTLKKREDLLQRAELRIFAFDIETTKLPLKFPDADIDSIMMISYMVDGQGYLIINRECVSEDIEDFEYTPKPEFEGPFTIFNEKTEIDLLVRFFDHIRELKPNVYVTFNGDFFDWPFIDSRASLHGMKLTDEIGVFKNSSGEYHSRFASHLDAFKWVVRDSYLPAGSQGLKAVTKAKLGYNPVEVDPEDMVRFALEKPQTMASYSVSDAVATFYLYMKYVHPFIFSLCTIIPMNPDDVLRKGSGTLCETLLMVEAAKGNIIFPNKQMSKSKHYNGHLLESETYVGGHVEALQTGIYRNDLPEKFDLDPKVFQELIDQLEKTLKYTIEIEEKLSFDDIENYDEVKNEILTQLLQLKSTPTLIECPNIYHLDVGAMYPNIILTNRLQPSSIVSNEDCAACDFNTPENKCQRNMEWTWRGDYIPATNAEYKLVLNQLESEKFKIDPKLNENRFNKNLDQLVIYSQLPKLQRDQLLSSRLKEYSKKVYGKTHQIKEEIRVGTVCQRENPFYVDTVRAFRDRRYTYKDDLKTWKGKLDKALKRGNLESIQECKNMNVLYDSLQLAHKCILNSFYGYVMRKGARWFSMEMAGIVTYTGAHIIKRAREVLDGVGKPLELDTDGIWTLLPQSFPENYQFTIKKDKQQKYSGKSKIVFSYPCVVLNYRVRDQFLNSQYQILNEKTGKYEMKEECSILFEVDGPYRAVVLPASTEEGKKLKKRYAVFNNDAEGSLAELKGFEVKRRGELKVIKLFQSQVFKTFLKGSTKEECYAEVGKVADHWLDILFTKGQNMIDEELLSLISCSNNMSKKLEDYGAQKSTAITTAKRLAEFLGNQIVKDKGLQCRFIISSLPARAPVVERAIPVAIFSAESAVCSYYLQKWLGISISPNHFNIRDIIDWDYYITRFGGTVQKIITIPAAFQKISNPVPRIPHPAWLIKKIDQNSGNQLKIQFKKIEKSNPDDIIDIENLVGSKSLALSTPSNPIPRSSKNTIQFSSSSSSSSTTKSLLGKRKHRNLDDNDDHSLFETSNLADQPMPDINENFEDWLAWSKARWRRQKQQKLQNQRKSSSQRPLTESPNTPAPKRRMTFKALKQTGLLTKHQNILYEKTWEIIQIIPIDNSPGEFRVWALVDDKMYPIQLQVPHILYIHSKSENPNEIENLPNVRTSNFHLPHSKKNKFLYKLELSELQYQKHIKDIQALSNLSDIEGIYETQTPSLFRALLQIGCLCRYNDKSSSSQNEKISIWESLQTTNNRSNFGLSQLSRIDDQEYATNYDIMKSSYLSDPNSFRLCYLYVTFTENRSVYCLILPHTKMVHIFFVSVLPKCSTPNIESFYEKYLPDFTFDLKLFKQNSLAVSQLNQIIGENKKRFPGPTIYLLQSSPDGIQKTLNEIYVDKIWSNLRDFPVVPLYGNKKDNQYPAFAWEGYCIKLITTRYKNSLDWFNIQREFCKYAQIPIGNLTRDYPILSSDLSFSRYLNKQNMILWISPTTFPDLGSNYYSNSALIDEIRYPERCRSSCLTSVSISMKLRNLALNTILQSHHVNDIEDTHNSNIQSSSFQKQTPNSQQISSFNDFSSTLDDSLLCFPAFRILKQLITKWALDLENENKKVSFVFNL